MSIFAIDPLLVWEIIQKDLPDFKKQIEHLLENAGENTHGAKKRRPKNSGSTGQWWYN